MKNHTIKNLLWRILPLLLSAATLQAVDDVVRPNIIVIMVDDMGYSDIGCYGSEINTPNLDRLADSGLRVRQFYNTSKCHSSRVTLLSGLHSYEAGSPRANGELPLHNSTVTRGISIAEALRDAGYYTAVSGKWHIKPDPWDFGFDRFFGFLPGYTTFFNSPTLQLDQIPYESESDDTYLTDEITDHALNFIEEAQREEKPFFLYLAYNAPHYPMQAPQEEINKYRGSYRDGWLAVRERRLTRMKELGLVGEDWTPADPDEVGIRDWETLSEDDQDFQDHIMATYAGMIDRLDQNVGRILNRLESDGLLDNTLILFFSDNGACEVTMRPEREQYERTIPMTQSDSFVTVGADWAFVSNTPYRQFKTHMHEGGVMSPFIAHWPQGISLPGGSIDDRNAFHIMDIMPTLIEVGGASYPDSYEQREELQPMNGVSMLPAFNGDQVSREDGIYYMFGQNRAYRLGDWKLVCDRRSRWALYNLAEDPTEQNDLAAQYPDRVKQLEAMWWDVARNQERLPSMLSGPNKNKAESYQRAMLKQGDKRIPKARAKE